MNEDVTRDLTVDEKLDLVLAELTSVKTELASVKTEIESVKTEVESVKIRLTSLEAIAADRSRETRPMLDRILKEVADTRAEVQETKDRVVRLELKFDVLGGDMLSLRSAQRDIERRQLLSERSPA